jgi:tetratricopeptide (TPR) repeat protein
MKLMIVFLSIAMIAGCTVSETPKEVRNVAEFDTLWNYGDPKGTEEKFRELIPKAKESSDASYYAQLLTQIARTQGLQGKYDDAHSTLDTVESMLTAELATARVRYLLERGRVYNSSNNPDMAKPLFAEAWETAVRNKEDFYAVDAAHMMGIVEPPENQLEWAEKAIALVEKTDDERARKWMGPLYNNTGWTYHDLGQYDKALELFEKSLVWREEQGDEEGTRIAKWTIARTYRSLGKIEEALVMQKSLEKERVDKGIEPSGYVFEEIAECLLCMDQKEDAQPYFRRAYDILSKDEWLVANESERLERLKKMGSQ